MEIPVIKIGNSKGIILSKTIIERYGIGDKIEIVMKEDHLELNPVAPPRQGRDEAFREMLERGDDELIGNDVLDDELIGNDVLDDDIFEECDWE
jgi:antitoxin MazE